MMIFARPGATFIEQALLRFNDPARFNTVCTNPYSFYLTILNTSHPLEVGVPSFFCFIVGMTDIVAYYRLFAANFTNFCHFGISFKTLPAIAIVEAKRLVKTNLSFYQKKIERQEKFYSQHGNVKVNNYLVRFDGFAFPMARLKSEIRISKFETI